MTDAEGHRILDDANAKLAEFFDCVQIMVSTQDGGATQALMRGVGNFYARQGLAQKFITMELAEDQATAIKKTLDPPDDSDAWKME